MEVQRIARYAQASYPDMVAAQADPALLEAVPERWKKSAAACAGLAAASAMLLSACMPSPADDITALPTGSSALPVPFFVHGAGRGGFGCVAIVPPAFLSESEAYAIIQDIAASEGLDFKQDGAELQDVYVPRTNTSPLNEKSVLGFTKRPLILDGYDAEKKIAYEFISKQDVAEWDVPIPNGTVSVADFSFIDTARALNDSLNRSDSGMTVAVFYDPGYRPDEITKLIKQYGDEVWSRADTKELRSMIKEDLRAQVRDFIAWLKAQGIV